MKHVLISLKSLRLFPLVAILVLGAFSLAFSQETTGSIEGTIKDPQGNLVAGVPITVTGVTVGFTRTTNSKDDGRFVVTQLPPGTYKVTAAASSGFGEQVRESVEVVLGKATTVEFSLQPAGATGTVVISESETPISMTDNKIQTNITAQIADLLPKGTNFTSLLAIAPAVRNEPLSGGFQIDGASGSENTFVIDGQEVSNFRTGTLNTNNNIPFQFVQDIQVKSSGFEAEFGGATGGVINVVTRSGSNEFHGEFGLSFRPAALQAGPRPFLTTVFASGPTLFSPKRDGGTDEFVTASFAGPIIRDRAWFVLSHSPQYLHTTRSLTYRNPNTGVVAGAETYNATQTNWYDFARLDANFTDNLRFSGSYTYNPIVQDGLVDAFSSQFSTTIPSVDFGSPIGILRGSRLFAQEGGRQNSQNVTGQLTWTPTTTLVVAARGGYSYLNEKLSSYGVPPIVGQARILCSTSGVAAAIPAEAGCLFGQSNRPSSQQLLFDASRRRTFDIDAAYFVSEFAGRHQFKGGFQINALANDIFNSLVDTVSIRYGRSINQTSGVSSSILAPTPGAIGSGFVQLFSTKGSASSKNQAFFFQDTWQPTPRLSLNLGFRVEKEDAPSFTPGNESIVFDYFDKFAPRVGGAYDLTGNGKTKLFASWGWFYDRFKYELPRGSFGGDFFHNLYFEIFPGDGRFDSLTPQRILGGYSPTVGGNCPITPSGGSRVRCDLDFRIPSNSGLGIEFGAIDPDLKPFRQSEITVGFERELSSRFLLSGRYSHKQVDRAVEDIGFSSPTGSEAFIIGNPGEGLAANVGTDFGFIPLKAEREYDAVEIRLDKHLSKNYYFNANYTWSRLFGNYSGLASSDEEGRTSPNVNRNFDLPIVGFTALGQPDNGRLPTDRPHSFKFYGGYNLNWKDRLGFAGGNSTDFSMFTTLQSGTPLTTRFVIFNIDNMILNGRGDLGRTEAFTQTDFSLHHRYRFGGSERFSLVFDLDVLNLFNEMNVLGIFDNISSTNIDATTIGLAGNAPTAEAQFQRTPTRDKIVALLNSSGGAKDARFGLANSFQGGRSIRFGVRFLF
jgi:TonB dependent receptor/Carboxypeptidase regulatory-like domain/TonB-dependent Receptor Plug Domain